MPLPKQIVPHKDKIVIIGLLVGGAYAAAVSFGILDMALLKGNGAYVVIGASAAAIWVFYEGFIKMRQLKRKIMPNQQGMPIIPQQPTPEDLGLAQQQQYHQPVYQRPPLQQAPVYPEFEPPRQVNRQPTPEDIFKDFQ